MIVATIKRKPKPKTKAERVKMTTWEVRLEMVEHYTVEVEASPNASREEVMALALDGDNRGDEYDHELQKETALSATRLREAGGSNE